MGKFDDVIAEGGAGDLAALTSSPLDDVHEDDLITFTDGDGADLTVAYYIRDECDSTSPLVVGIHFATPANGAALSIEAAEQLAEWLVGYVDQAKAFGLA